VHRDIKPANIFMVGRTQPRVLDFGIARVAHQHDASGDDIAAGSPYYMAPEQVRQEPVDRRGDVFSLGVVLYELLTGQKPFRGNSLTEITTAVLEHEPPLAHEVDPQVPKGLSEIAARAMEKDAEHRFRSARALSRELRHWLEEHGQENEAVEAATAASDERSRLVWAGAAAAGVLVAAFAWWMLMPHHHGSEPSLAATSVPEPPAALPAPAAAAPADTASSPAPVVAAAVAPEPASAAVERPISLREGVPVAAAKDIPKEAPKVAPRESARERKAREARERDARAAAVAPATGSIRLAVSPWGQVEVDGTPVGTAPPLTEITLSEGKHQIVVRNADFPPYSASVNISAGTPVTLKHKFGS